MNVGGSKVLFSISCRKLNVSAIHQQNKMCVPFYTSKLVITVQWCRLWHTLSFSCRESNFCFVFGWECFIPSTRMNGALCVVQGCPVLTCETSGIITASFVRGTMFIFHSFPNILASAAVHAVLLPLLPCVCCLSTPQHFLWERDLVPHSESWEGSSLESWQHEWSLSFNISSHYGSTEDKNCQIGSKTSTLCVRLRTSGALDAPFVSGYF